MTLRRNAVWMGQVEYACTAEKMLSFTDARDSDTADEIWMLEHTPVYTRGTSCRIEVTENPDAIPVIQSNRGGQITYHGPGQLVVYLLLDIKRLGFGPRRLVQTIEGSIIALLEQYGLQAERRLGAPGVYVDHRKIAALGLRIRNGKCFHGLSLNVDMNLDPFKQIDPCGIPQLQVTQLRDMGIRKPLPEVASELLAILDQQFQWEATP